MKKGKVTINVGKEERMLVQARVPYSLYRRAMNVLIGSKVSWPAFIRLAAEMLVDGRIVLVNEKEEK